MKSTDIGMNEGWNSPMGVVNKGIHKLVSKVPAGWSDKADQMRGNLNTGTVANDAWSTYQSYLGQIGEKASLENITTFLKNNKYSPEAISAAQNVIKQSSAALAKPKAAKFGGTAKAATPAPKPAVQGTGAPGTAGAARRPTAQRVPPKQASTSRGTQTVGGMHEVGGMLMPFIEFNANH